MFIKCKRWIVILCFDVGASMDKCCCKLLEDNVGASKVITATSFDGHDAEMSSNKKKIG
jgi:hypothetical protein